MIAIAISGGDLGLVVGAITAALTLTAALIELSLARRPRPVLVAAGTSAERPRSSEALPQRRPSFVNRVNELQEAVGRIHAGEVALAIEGGIGVGKSATAIQLAHRLRDDDGPVDGAPDTPQRSFVWIDCENRCPSLTEFCGALAILTENQSLTAVAENEKIPAIRAHLAENRTVLLLDNLRLGDDEESDAMRKLIAAVPSGSLVIASLNSPGSLAAARLQLDDLEPTDARLLIEAEIERQGSLRQEQLGADFADRVLAILGGNPGMITWFLRGLAASPKSIDELLDAAERGQGFEGVVAPIWDELSADSKAVLGMCAHLDGQAIAAQLALGWGVSEARVSAALEDLIGAGLVTVVRVTGRPNVFSCAAGVRRFALAQTPPEAIESFTERLAEHYTRRFTADWENAADAIDHVGAFRLLVEQLYDEHKDEQLYALYLATLDILYTLGRFDDRIAIAVLAYESARRRGDFSGASRAAATRAVTRAVRGELGLAREALALGLDAAGEAGSPAEAGRQKRVMGFVEYRSKRPRAALAATEGAAELSRQAGDLHNLVDVLDVRMACHWYLGEFDACEELAAEHLRLCHEMPWRRAEAYSLRQLAEAAIHGRRFEQAADLLSRARAVSTEHHDRRMLVRIGVSEARLGLIAGQPAQAVAAAAASERDAGDLGLREEAREARALRKAAKRARFLPLAPLYYRWRRPHRLTDAPIGGD